jgi:hypothetical protein
MSEVDVFRGRESFLSFGCCGHPIIFISPHGEFSPQIKPVHDRSKLLRLHSLELGDTSANHCPTALGTHGFRKHVSAF